MADNRIDFISDYEVPHQAYVEERIRDEIAESMLNSLSADQEGEYHIHHLMDAVWNGEEQSSVVLFLDELDTPYEV
jgi:hypothetical protein